MTRASTIALVILLAATAVAAQTPAPAPAPAPPPAAQPAPAPQFPAVRVGMVSYLQYDAELKNRAAFNAFDLTRGYINVTAAFSPNLRFRFTPDIRRATDGSLSGSLVLRVKYGFLQVDNVGPATSWVRLGLSQTPWVADLHKSAVKTVFQYFSWPAFTIGRCDRHPQSQSLDKDRGQRFPCR